MIPPDVHFTMKVNGLVSEGMVRVASSILGLQPGAVVDARQVKAAYHRLQKMVHPDRAHELSGRINTSEAETATQRVTIAYNLVKEGGDHPPPFRVPQMAPPPPPSYRHAPHKRPAPPPPREAWQYETGRDPPPQMHKRPRTPGKAKGSGAASSSAAGADEVATLRRRLREWQEARGMTQAQLLAQLHAHGGGSSYSAGSLSAWLASKVQTQRTSTWFADAARAFLARASPARRRPGP